MLESLKECESRIQEDVCKPKSHLLIALRTLFMLITAHANTTRIVNGERRRRGRQRTSAQHPCNNLSQPLLLSKSIPRDPEYLIQHRKEERTRSRISQPYARSTFEVA